MDYPEASEATVRVLSDKELASALRERGAKVVEHRERFWTYGGSPGFLVPIHPLARMTPEEATRPTLLCWGYLAALRESAASRANGAIVPYLIGDLKSYGESRLTRRKREALRQCRRETRIVQLTDSALLDRQGYRVYLSYAERLAVKHPLDAR